MTSAEITGVQTQAKSHDVFLSHSSTDRNIALSVAHGLEAQGIRCWLASRDIIPGAPYDVAIVQAIEASSVLVLIFSEASNKSKEVLNEVRVALDSDVAVLPFRLHNVALSPSLKYGIPRAHWLDALTPPVEQHIAALIKGVMAFLPAQRAPFSDAPDRTQPSPQESDGGYVYVSCATEDWSAVAPLVEALRSARVEVWLSGRPFHGRENVEEVVTQRIRHASLFVPILSNAVCSPGKRFFRLEWDEAIRMSETLSAPFIVPVQIEDVDASSRYVPGAFKQIQHLYGRNAAELRDAASRIRELYGLRRVRPLR